MNLLCIDTCCGFCSVALYKIEINKDSKKKKYYSNNINNNDFSIDFKLEISKSIDYLNMQVETISSITQEIISEVIMNNLNKSDNKSDNINNNLKKDNNKIFSYIDAIAVTTGPGSFTGNRIGLSYAYGIKMSLSEFPNEKEQNSKKFPIIPFNTLDCIASKALDKIQDKTNFQDKINYSENIVALLPAGIDKNGENLYYYSRYSCKKNTLYKDTIYNNKINLYRDIDYKISSLNEIYNDIEKNINYSFSEYKNEIFFGNCKELDINSYIKAEDIILGVKYIPTYNNIVNKLLFISISSNIELELNEKEFKKFKEDTYNYQLNIYHYPLPYYIKNPNIG
ncbi:hypothetical protein [Lyticum sinuosum]|uniref:Camboamyltransferase-related domain protein n=1 Tax=Lyticum sinuosum TaxID=1332059 RepID=A0AAE4VL81_9RICK|nr:hypothetical protein [Lyticum sinuosum]MDZ5761474.1 putative camboamyltransferase-related domain protein [Lyticum sinuosum]